MFKLFNSILFVFFLLSSGSSYATDQDTEAILNNIKSSGKGTGALLYYADKAVWVGIQDGKSDRTFAFFYDKDIERVKQAATRSGNKIKGYRETYDTKVLGSCYEDCREAYACSKDSSQKRSRGCYVGCRPRSCYLGSDDKVEFQANGLFNGREKSPVEGSVK